MLSNPPCSRDRVVDWQWVFAALWSLCGNGDPIKLCVPETLLIRNGLPYKMLATDSMKGHLIRKQIGPLLVSNTRNTRRRSSPRSSLVIRKQIVDIVDSFDGSSYGDGARGCLVWYSDGLCEHITRQDLFKMALSDRWRSQLVGIQECIVEERSSSNRLTGVVGQVSGNDTASTGTSSAAANILAASIASHVERSYNKRGDIIVGSGNVSNGLLVVSLVADFILDGNQRLWFSHAKRLVVRYPTTTCRSSVGDPRAAARSLKIATAAEIEARSAGERLRVALRSAMQRKVGKQACFDHFDAHGVGYVGAGGLQDGLSRLGLEVSDSAVGLLMCWIARANGLHFGSSDLADFALRSELRLGGGDDGVDPGKRGGDMGVVGVEISNCDLANANGEGDHSSSTQPLSSTCNDFNENGADVPFEVELPVHTFSTSAVTNTTVHDDTMACEDVDTDANELSTYESDVSSKQESIPDEDNNEQDDGESRDDSDEGSSASTSSISCSTCSDDTPETKNQPTGTTRSASFATEEDIQADVEERRAEMLSLDAYRTDPNNVAAFQEAATQGREKARALRALVMAETNLDEMLDGGRRRAIRREQQRVAVADAKRSTAKLELDALRNTIEQVKGYLQQQQQQQQQLVVVQDGAPNDRNRIVDKDRATAILEDILLDITSSGETLEEVRSKQRQTQARLDEYNKEVRSADRLVKQLQESLSGSGGINNSSAGGTGPSPSTAPFATRELRIRLNRAMHKLERATELRNRAKKQLVNYNQSVQFSTIAFRQKQKVGKDLLVWTEDEGERCKGDICQLRQQREDLGNESSLLERKIRASQRRISAIQDELGRLHHNTCTGGSTGKRQKPGQGQGQGQGQRRYFDTSLWHDDGLMQRMKTDDFIELVEKERSTLQNDLAVHHFRSHEIIEEQDYIKKLLSDHSKLLAQLNIVRSRLCNYSFIGARTDKSLLLFAEGEARSSSPSEVGTSSNGNSIAAVTSTPTNPTSRIRRKRHDLLTGEEKEWLRLDYSINPHLYNNRVVAVSGGRPEGMPIVSPKVVDKILNLPEQIQLALPFLKSSEEVRAHFLINKFTLGRGELYFRAVDVARTCTARSSVGGGGDDVVTAAKTPPTLATCCIDVSRIHAGAAGKDENDEYFAIAKEILLPVAVEQTKIIGNDTYKTDSKSDTSGTLPFVCASLEELIQAHTSDERITQPPNLCFISSSNIIESLHNEVSTLTIERGEKQTHRVVIEPSRLHMIHSMIITVIFQGTFTSTGYSPGRISVSLARRQHCHGHGRGLRHQTTTAASGDTDGKTCCNQYPFTPIGYSLHEEQTVNTNTSMGRIVIRHCDEAEAVGSPVMPVTYELLVTAESDARYSISIAGTICTNAQLVLQREMASFLQKRHAIENCEADGSSLFDKMRLAERKLILIGRLFDETNTELDRCKGDIEQCDLLLDKHNRIDDDDDDDSDDDGSISPDQTIDQIYSDIKVLESEYAQLSFSLAGREKQRRDIRLAVESMARLRLELLENIKKLKQIVTIQRKTLPLAASALFGTKCGAKVERVVSVRAGAASSTVAAAEAVENIVRLSSTPAEKVRRLARREATLSNLTLEERHFCLLDRVLYPSKWTWLDSDDDDDDDATCMTNSEEKVHVVPPSMLLIPTESEIRRIKSTPFDQLRRKADKDVKHLLLKYHDRALPTKEEEEKLNDDDDADADASSLPTTAAAKTVNRGALAAKTRSKSKKMYSKTDHEWQSIDLIVNPEEWNWRYGGRKPPLFSLRQRSDAWTCPFTRDEILAIWQSKPSSDKLLPEEDQRRTFSLLMRYNGAFQDHSSNDAQRAIDETGLRYRYSKRLQSDTTDRTNVDADDQCHLIQAELDRAIFCRDDFLVSSILNGTPQRYPTHILRLELERELDRLLIEQVLLREQEMELLGGLTNANACTCTRESDAKKKGASAQILDDNVITDLGENGCLACESSTSRHRMYGDIAALQEKKDKLSQEIFLKRREHRNALSDDDDSSALEELHRQLRQVESQLQLAKVDAELHELCASTTNSYHSVTALHGYTASLSTKNAVATLQQEQDKLVAVAVAGEMGEGSYFGEPVSHNTCKIKMGIAFGDTTNTNKTPTSINVSGGSSRVSIDHQARARHQRLQSTNAEENRQKELNRAENTVRFGLLLLVFGYFRSRHMAREQQNKLSGALNALEIEGRQREL